MKPAPPTARSVARKTATQRHAALRQRKRAAGLQRRTVWLGPAALQDIADLKLDTNATQDEVIAKAISHYAAAVLGA